MIPPRCGRHRDVPDRDGVLEMSWHEDGSVSVGRTDPCLLVSLLTLDQWRRGEEAPVVQVSVPDPRAWNCCSFLDGIIRIRAANRDVIYRITGCNREYLDMPVALVAEWPD